MTAVHADGDTPPALDTARAFVVRHRLLVVALLLVVVFHGSLLLAGSYQRTYDAYVHMFFADHYARSWFSAWDDRWYTGFSTLSYPPGSHQAVAAVSLVVGLRTGFVVVQLSALLCLTIGCYRWARIWVDPTSAGWAAVALVLSSSIAETVHVFGQLPTTFSLGFLLNALPSVDRWVRAGDRRALIVGVGCTMATTAAHHVTTLFGAVFFVGPVLLAALLANLRTPHPDERGGHPARVRPTTLWPLVARRLRRVLPALARAAVFTALLVLALVAVVLPYWLYSHTDPITQVTIPHASRDSFIDNPNAGLVFWLVPWGTTLIALPYALLRGFAGTTWPLAASLAGLTLLGTGGTTPVPRLLLGGAFDILTLDRFTFWATICVLPLVGRFAASLVNGTLHRALVNRVGGRLAVVLPGLLLVSHVGVTLFAANLTHYRPFQPAAIDVAPVTAFLAKDDHDRWRYLTLGFGDQMAWLAANTTAQTVDGDYHSARALPELTTRPVERLENAKYSGVPGIGSLQQFLAVPERYNLKYVFSVDQFYAPLLDASGWTDLGTLENGVEVWERADVPPLPVADVSHEPPAWQRYEWGTVPPASILGAVLLLAWSGLGSPLPERWRRGATSTPTSLWLPARPRAWRTAAARRLAAAADRVPVQDGPADTRWLPWPSLLTVARGRAARPVGATRRRLQATVTTTAVAVVVAGCVVALLPERWDAAGTVAAYYDDLDFRRLADAYARLDPATRPDFAQYQLDQNADGGLVASFGKLQSVTSDEVGATGDRVTLQVTRTYLTSLQQYTVVGTTRLRRTGEGWVLDLPPADPTVPPDQFTSRPGVQFLSQGRRAPTSGPTSDADVLDRPQLRLTDVSSLRVEGRWVVIGQVTNIDVDPADVTVDAQLRDRDGHLLATWNASQVIVHKLLPGASSPFRIEFQSIAGTGAYGAEVDGGVRPGSGDPGVSVTPASPQTSRHGPVDFDPQAITPLALPAGADVASVGVYARAVVTPYVAADGLQVTALRVEGRTLHGTVRNDGTVTAAVPHLLFAYSDAAGRLRWVDHVYLEHSVAPQRATPFVVALPDLDGVEPSRIATTSYAGPQHDAAPGPTGVLLPLTDAGGITGVAVTATAYVRTAGT